MLKDESKSFSYETEVVHQGAYVKNLATNPEVIPVYMTTAFNVEDLAELQQRYDAQGFCYNRNRNPNRSALAELVSYAEGGEESVITGSGIAAISTTLLALLKSGDHVLADKTLYGETIDFLDQALIKYGITATHVDFTNLDEVKAAIKGNTRIFYTETVSNPMITVVDIRTLADIAHANGALLVVDNTFMTSVAIRPLKHGADVVVNSLTKFANGHSDAVCGSATGPGEIINKVYHLQILLGTIADAFTCWLVERGMRTMSLRLEKQMGNAVKLAQALKESPYVLKVHHPSLPDHPQHELAARQFNGWFGGMMSIELPEDRERINAFMRRLNLAHYAMTLGGYRTSIAHPASSSHYDMAEEERRKIGITYGLVRISTGIENPDDLIRDFRQALEVYA